MADATVPSLEGRTFHTVGTHAAGEATAETLFEYHEDDGVVWARYSGGTVVLGYIVGVRTEDELDIRYSQLSTGGESAGTSAQRGRDRNDQRYCQSQCVRTCDDEHGDDALDCESASRTERQPHDECERPGHNRDDGEQKCRPIRQRLSA